MITANEIKELINQKQLTKALASLFFLRSDGILIYSEIKDPKINEGINLSSFAVLAAGAWQASRAMFNEAKILDEDSGFRFQFDLSSGGVYFLEIKIAKDTFLLGTLYNDEINPGALKNRLRMIKYSLENDFDLFSKNDEPKPSGFLFENITDDEIENLFKTRK